MAITVVGSVAFDSIETPAGRRERCLGGAATYFSLSASFFTDVRVIAVVGEDFGPEQEAVFQARNIDTRGIEHTAGKSFFWEGSYLENLNEAKTHTTDLNVFAAFEPKIPEAYRDSEFLFLANIDPVLQRRVREQMPDVRLVAGDTMNYWIKDHRAALLLRCSRGWIFCSSTIPRPKCWPATTTWCRRRARCWRLGPETLVVKHGEYGATLFHSSAPQNERRSGISGRRRLPLEVVVDPTGAGDSFAGGFFGYLASQPRTHSGRLSPRHVLRQRDGLVRVRALWHRAAAVAYPQGDRRPLHFVPRVDSP
jgi:sugar/nucleoside kinase (ribokinase family)